MTTRQHMTRLPTMAQHIVARAAAAHPLATVLFDNIVIS
jgi:hypothetical protein